VRGDSFQRGCNLIVKGLLLTYAVFPRFKVPKPLQWDADCRPKATGSRTPIRALPVDPPSPPCHGHPEQSLGRGSSRMMVKRSGSLIESASVPRVREFEFLKIKMVAELVAQSAHERTE